ncbi:hypothetical protein OI18_13405 [Flavihumibacter solisilvae]|uniref:Uncharacterized protein n=1 Tax=Flavihumibacter solisilvae TaxID=1349421 RepID=A0A0C1IU87_9BACT|nr:hypothetical protein OI18_13405 [Flavihumibacter solisilvae]
MVTQDRIVVTCITPQENGTIIARLYNPEPAREQTGQEGCSETRQLLYQKRTASPIYQRITCNKSTS